MLDLFAEKYGCNGCIVFIPPVLLQLWQGEDEENARGHLDWNRWAIANGSIEKAFEVVPLSGHWSVLEADFSRREISFGDSLSYNTPELYVAAVRKWSACNVEAIEKWTKRVMKFKVPR
jgi:hypothetical protein